jgi:hypothetical protein
MRERQRIAPRPGRHQEDGNLALEDVRERLLDAFRQASLP